MNYRFFYIVIIVVLLAGVADANVTTITTGYDAITEVESHDLSFANIRIHAASASAGTATTTWVILSSLGLAEGHYLKQTILEMGFDGSAIPDTATIDSAKLRIVQNAQSDGFGSLGLRIINTSDADTTTATADYLKRGFVAYSDAVPKGSFSSGSYTNISYNAAGLASISKTGYFYLVLTTAWDANNTAPSPELANTESYFQFRAFEYTGTGSDPIFEVTWHIPAPPVSSFTATKPLYQIQKTIQVNDTSTNTPTQWNWSWGDGTWTNGTTQNATHKYTTRGKKSILLLTSNADGANTTPTATMVRIVGYENLWF
jgi:hypothetical protein